jgi:hypothetical protein
VVWDLNPNHLDQAAGSSTVAYTQAGYTITASGYDNNNGVGTAHELYYKNKTDNNGAVEFGLGLVNTTDNELQVGSDGTPFQFIQFNLTSIVAAGFTDGKVKVGSIQAGEAFSIYGSNAAGILGTQLGGTFGSATDNKFVSIPDFGLYKYYSVVSADGDVLPISLSAEIPAIPEMNALLPIIGLIVAVGATNALRRRRARAA